MHRLLCSASVLLALLVSVEPGAADDWTRFRGNDGQGHATSLLPLEWSEQEHIAWSTDLPGSGSSSPIVVGDRVFVTCYSGESGPDARRTLVCVNANSGDITWQESIPAPASEDRYAGYLTEHGYASGTPVSDGEAVYAFFGKGGVVAYSVDGRKLWHSDLGQMSSNREWGSAASPVLAGDVLIVNASEEARAVFGLDKTTGEELWKATYDALELCYATPVILPGEGGVTEAVLPMAGEVWGLNVENGKLRWFCEVGVSGNVCPSVVVGPNAFYTFGGFPEQRTYAIRRGGRNDITDTHVLWQSRDSSYVPTPLFHDGHLYWVSDRGQSYCVNADSGETVTRNRLSGLAAGGRAVYASPVKSGDHILVVTRRSGTYVFEATPEMTQVAKNPPLDDSDFNATPAFADGRLFLRSNERLYCIQ